MLNKALRAIPDSLVLVSCSIHNGSPVVGGFVGARSMCTADESSPLENETAVQCFHGFQCSVERSSCMINHIIQI